MRMDVTELLPDDALGEARAAAETTRAFLAAHRSADGRWPSGWSRTMAEAGYVAPHWPKPWGLAASPVEQLVIDAELRAAGAPKPMNPIGIGWAGPTLLVAGSPEQHERYLPGLLDGSEIWCQLFSEPEAGSDLASLTTRKKGSFQKGHLSGWRGACCSHIQFQKGETCR
jgi:alkylation response protein AidB-like acyl-CoA dehydrogenase